MTSRTPFFVYATGLILALVPVVLMIAVDLTTPPDRAFMWELQYDQFYYAANARQMIQDGFHFAHANPYDPRPAAPRIYSHLFTLLAAGTAAMTGIEPLHTYFVLRPILGVLLAVSIWYFLSAIVMNRDLRRWAFLFLMFSGGSALVLSWVRAAWLSTGSSATLGDIWGASYVRFEEVYGDWLCNIARNYLYTPELLYHLLWFTALGLYLRGRHPACALVVALELYAHPFTGLALAAVAGTLFLMDVILGHERLRSIAALGVIGAGLLAFYTYMTWLSADPGHRIIQDTWERFMAVIPLREYPRLYGMWLVGGLAAAILTARAFRESQALRCVWVQGMVVMALSHHHLFLSRMVQPAHFSRGYFFTALVGLTFIVIERYGRRLERYAHMAGRWAWVILLTLSLDNLSFLFFVYLRASDAPMTIGLEQKAMIQKMADIRVRHFVASDGDMGVLIPVFTPHRTLLGHRPMTPAYDNASALLSEWTHLGRRTLFYHYRDLSLACLPRRALAVLQVDPVFLREWKPIQETPEYVLYERTGMKP